MNPLLIVALVFGAVVVVAFLFGWFVGYPEKIVPGAKKLSAKEQAIVKAAADTYFPTGGRLGLSGAQAGAVEYFDRQLEESTTRMVFLIRLLLLFVEHFPWFMLRRRFTSQLPWQREATLRAWTTSEIYMLRVIATSLRTLISFGYMASDDVCARIGCTPNMEPFSAKGTAQ